MLEVVDRRYLHSSQAVKNANVKAGDWVVVVGAGGGLGHLAGTLLYTVYLFSCPGAYG